MTPPVFGSSAKAAALTPHTMTRPIKIRFNMTSLFLIA
jgi:hypothetical protein